MNERKHLYFAHPLVDVLCMGGLSILVFLYYRLFFHGYDAIKVSDTALAAAAVFNWVVNYPHFAATSFRFYGSRDHLRQFPLTAFLVPGLMLLAVLACFAWPKDFAPIWVKVFLLWSAYHYSGQNLGLSLIYARRAGVDVHAQWRRVLSGFLFACFVAQYATVEASGGTLFSFGLHFPLLGIPKWVPLAARILAAGFGAATLYFAWRWQREHRRRIPWIVGLPALAQLTWTQLGAEVFSFQALVPLFHGLQYLLIAWSMEMHERAPVAGVKAKAPYVWGTSARWAIGVGLGGVALFVGLPRLAALAGYEIALATAVFFVTVQVHHFFVDGVIWKLRGEGKQSPLFAHFSAAFGRRGG